MLMFLTRDTMKIQSTFGIICFVDRIIFFVYQKLKKSWPNNSIFIITCSVMSINTRKRRIEEKLEGPKAPERRAKKHAREPSIEDFAPEPPAKKRKLNNSDSVEITKVVPAREKPIVNVDAGEVVMAKRSDEAGGAVARKTYIVDSFDELPEDLRRKVIKSEIAEVDADKYFAYVINILHFKTKHNFYTTDQYKNRHKPQQRRYNNGPSKVSDSIVSVNSLEAEAEELLSKDFKKRNYKFVIQIGKGGFGRVFMVKSVKDKGKIAVKRIPHVTSKQQRKNFQEMRFLQYAKHPNIIKYLRSYLVGDEIWLMTEYMQGGTLTQAVAVHKFEEDQVAYICQQILFALDFLHDNQLMHRDLKSANIMLDFNDGSVKLIDFGLCSDVSQGEVVHMVGSPFWMPPEMIRRDPHGLPVDIWSLGVCLMELANGHPPNRKSSIKAMFVAVTDGYPEPFEDPKRFSNEFKDFMSHCLQIAPAQRWTVKQLLAHPWLKRAASKDDMERLFRNIFVANKLKFNGL